MAHELVRLTSAARDQTIAALSDAFARGDLDIDEFDRRLTLAHAAGDAGELTRLTEDLPAVTPSSNAATPALVPPGQVRARGRVLAIMGGVERRGAWQVPRHLNVMVAMGGVQLDFREARLPAGPVDVHVTAFMGGIQLILPPNLAVEVHGTALMGGFQDLDRSAADPDPSAPLLRVHGLAIMGGVEVETRLPGESARQARKRRRLGG